MFCRACGLSIAWMMLAVPGAKAQERVDFERDIQPILEEHCWHCHGADEQESGLRLDLRQSMLAGGDYGQPAIVPGKPGKSYLLEVVNHLDEEMAMPPDGEKLPPEMIERLQRWIEQGAPWPGQMEKVTREKSTHWAFQPIERPTVPQVASLSPIDAFLQRRLQREGLGFSEEAIPANLIRRASIVLTGLPPTSGQIQAFERDYRQDPTTAYEELVERLLASPHFGERWAQHWLDVIRWAETNGSESNLYRKNAWIYRDYVIRSFNEDKPYDQFLREQLAGDRLGVGEATGYLVAGPHVPVATVGQEPVARRQARADRMDEILQTVGASALGLSIGCARCHNHKFDPISIRDYYAMSDVFQDIEFGSRLPELSPQHPRKMRGNVLRDELAEQRAVLRTTGPWQEDWNGYRELHFPKTKTGAVRISFQWKGARVDELEILGPRQWQKNLALARDGTQAKSVKAYEQPRGELWKINDGQYGTEAWAVKWPQDGKEKPWVEFTFSEPQVVNRIRYSSNRQDAMQTDYLEGMGRFNVSPLVVETLDAEGNWKKVFVPGRLPQLDKQHPEREPALATIQATIEKLSEEGPQPSFVGKRIEPAKSYVLQRGSPEDPRDEVHAAGLEELEGGLGLPIDASGPAKRQAFARWLTGGQHPLTARVAANRLWYHVFGSGIVATTADFGLAGSRPSHPELLDWLASELRQPKDPDVQPWSVKHLLRQMVLSRAFRQDHRPNPEAIAKDADSLWLWRFPPRRLTAEAIRDSILQASGSLDLQIGGKGYRIHNVKKRYAQWKVLDNHGPATWRRMIYQERMRRVDDQMFTAFDFPDCGQVRPQRPISTTPLQALNLLNSDFVMSQSELIAQRAMQESDQDLPEAVQRCFQLLLGRDAAEDELAGCLELARDHGLTLVCRAILNSNEFSLLQ
ncbi:MAG: PSD1 and planctomycete cytochrome C domain-containing protein [Mariniblastus sp.]|nr:PSD1 and planctomycete cytochrome C domain-containing protein [Mariniblastus sp.]